MIKKGDRVILQNLKGEDRVLNGLKGKVTESFEFGRTGKDWIGVYLDTDKSPYGDRLNVRLSEVRLEEKISFLDRLKSIFKIF